MDQFIRIGTTWLHTLEWVAGLSLVFGLLVRLMPCNPGSAWWKSPRAALTDFCYWFVVPLFLTYARQWMTIAAVLLLFAGRELPAQGWPIPLQCLAILAIQDVILYFIHRVFHTRLAWPIHAIHHSPTELDWTATARFHPINNLLSFAVADVAVLLLGFSPEALIVLVPFNTVYSAMVHANLNWTFGPLRYVFASPVFHRWHHTTEAEGLDKNFASTFPVLDLVFGTFYMPADRLPVEFGNGEPDFPEGFWGQLIFPFRHRGVMLGSLGMVVVAGFLALRIGQISEQLSAKEQAAAIEAPVDPPSEAAWHGYQLDQAQAALAHNDVVRATDILDAIGEQHILRDLCRLKCLPLAGHDGPVLGVAAAADGQLVVSGSSDLTVKLWDAATGQLKRTIPGHRGTVTAVAISPDGQRIVSGSNDRAVRVWDVPTGAVLAFRGHTAPVLSVAISADGQRIVSGGADGTVRVWDTAEGKETLTLKAATNAVTGVALSGDGKHLVAASWGTLKMWDAATGKEERTFTGATESVYCVAISADGQRVVSGNNNGTVHIWDAATGKGQPLIGHSAPVYSVAISADGQHIVSGSADRTVKLWDAEGREECCLKGHTDSVTGVAIGGDGRRLFSSSRDGTVKVWDLQRCVNHRLAAAGAKP